MSIKGLSDWRIDTIYEFVLGAKITALPAYLRFDAIELQIGEHDAYESHLNCDFFVGIRIETKFFLQ